MQILEMSFASHLPKPQPSFQAICEGTSGLTMSIYASADQGDGSGGDQVCVDQGLPLIGPLGNECEAAPDEASGGEFVPDSQKNLTEGQRRAVYEFLLGRFEHGKLQYGALKAVANEFGVSSRTINRVWTRGRESLAGGNVYADVSSRMPGKKGRTKVVVDMEKFKAIDRRKRKNIRSAASAIGVSKSTLHRRIIEGIIKRHTNALKPYLTDANKASRLAYAVEQINESTLTGGDPHFFSQWDRVHIDEKWFYLTEECGTFYLASDEEDPHRTGKSKRFILKVMFLAAVALARFDHVKNQWFTGKIGISRWSTMRQRSAHPGIARLEQWRRNRSNP